MNEQWKQLKDTIVDIRDNNEFEHEDVTLMCRFLANYMEVLEKQMQEPCGDLISRQSAIFLVSDLKQDLPDDAHLADMVMVHNEGILEYQTQLSLLPSVNPQSKTGHWIAQDIHNCHTDFKCSECGYIHSFMHIYCEPTADYTYCPNCGAKMQEKEDKTE